MDNFDRLLELDLARLLDPILDAPAPRRRRRRGTGALTAVTGGLSVIPSDSPARVESVSFAIVTPVS